MIDVREFRESDIERIDKVYHSQSEFGVPSLNNIVVNVTIEKDGKEVIGYGVVKLFGEAVLMLDGKLSKRERAESLKASMQIAILKSRDAGLEMLYAISNDSEFSKVLRNRYGFKAVPGELLVLNLEDEIGQQGREKD
jgi:hypothetical protein